MAASRVAFTWFGVRKSLTAEQKAVAADSFDAEGQYLGHVGSVLDITDRREAELAVELAA